MHRIDDPTAAPGELFTEGTPGLVPATVVKDTWLNDMQENLAIAIEDAGIALVKGDSNQLKAAMQVYSALGGGTLATKVATFTATIGEAVLLCDATAGDMTANLPAAATAGSGKRYLIKKIDSSTNLVTVDADASETIDGQLNFDMFAQYDSVKVISDGTAWHTESIDFKGILRTNMLMSPGEPLISGQWPSMISNSLSVTPGLWQIKVNCFFTRSGGSSDVTELKISLGSANGVDTGAAPAVFSDSADVTAIEEMGEFALLHASGLGIENQADSIEMGIFRVAATTTAFLNAFIVSSTATVNFQRGVISAKRLNTI